LSIVEEAIKQEQNVPGIVAPEVSEVNVGGPTDHEAGTPYIMEAARSDRELPRPLQSASGHRQTNGAVPEP
jgi:hypothetical protein